VWWGALFGAGALLYWALSPAKAYAAASSRREGVAPTQQAAVPFPQVEALPRSAVSRHDQIDLTSAQIARWRPQLQGAAVVLAPMMHAEIDQLVQFGLAWIGIESGGNPCAVGNRTKVIPPANAPQEIGLWQIYNPDDFKELGVDPLELVAYCVRPKPGTVNPQKLSKVMTPEQVAKHVVVGLRMIGKKRTYAGRYLMASGVRWPTRSPDYWRMVKAVHALPVLVSSGIAAVTKKLGRAPASWAEYRSTYERINPRARFDIAKEKRGEDQDVYYRALENAEWTGGQVAGPANA